MIFISIHPAYGEEDLITFECEPQRDCVISHRGNNETSQCWEPRKNRNRKLIFPYSPNDRGMNLESGFWFDDKKFKFDDAVFPANTPDAFAGKRLWAVHSTIPGFEVPGTDSGLFEITEKVFFHYGELMLWRISYSRVYGQRFNCN